MLKRCFLTLCFIFILLVFLNLPCLSSTVGSKRTSGDKEFLKLLSFGYQTNINSLKTWSSQVDYIRKEKEETVIVNMTDFQFDIRAGALRTNTVWQLPRMRQEKHIVTYDFEARIGILLDDKGNRLHPTEPTIEGQIIVMSNETGPGEMNIPAPIAPMRYLSIVSKPEDFYDNWDTADWVGPVSIKREENIFTLRVEMGDMFNESKFDLTKGCNLISFTGGRIGNPEGKLTIEWEEVNGVFVPSHYMDVRYDNDTNSISRSEELTFSNNKVNEPIVSKVFTPEDLAVGIMSEGDVMMDHINNVKKVYMNDGSWKKVGAVMAPLEGKK